MTSRKAGQLTPLELEIMNVLWQTGAANVQTVQKGLGRDLAYTTVQTMLNILHRKGKVTRTLKDRAYFYKPALSRARVLRQTVGDIVERLFGGSAESLVMTLVDSQKLSRAQLNRLKKLLEDSAEGRHDRD
jgi:BlaI family transcriptional regulator, penicillinase repressor